MNSLKHILFESTYDLPVLNNSRNAINLFKSKFGKYVEYSNDELMLDKHGKTISYEVIIKFIPQNSMNGMAYSFMAESDNERLRIAVKYVPTTFPIVMNSFIAELKETLRHEIEHISQRNKSKGGNFEKFNEIPFYKYLLLRHEIPAFVMGLYKRAKTKRQSLSDAIDDYMTEYDANFKDETEKQIVKDKWMGWAKSNLKINTTIK